VDCTGADSENENGDFCIQDLDMIIESYPPPLETTTELDIDQDEINDIQIRYRYISGNTYTYQYFYIEPLDASVSIATSIHTDTLMKCDTAFMGSTLDRVYNLGSGFECAPEKSIFHKVDTIKFPSIISSLEEFNDSFTYENRRLYFHYSQYSPIANIHYYFWSSLSEKYILIKLGENKKGYLKLSKESNGDLIIHESGFRK